MEDHKTIMLNDNINNVDNFSKYRLMATLFELYVIL